MFHVKLFIMSYKFKYCFVRHVEREDFGGFKTSEVLLENWFYFTRFEEVAKRFVGAVISAAEKDVEGRGVRVYNFLDLFGLVGSDFEKFVEVGSSSFSSHIIDQTQSLLPTGRVKSVVLYYSFECCSPE